MAMVRICDRCKAIIEKQDVLPSDLILNYTDYNAPSAHEKPYDLCNSCLKELRNWFEEYKEGERRESGT